MNSIQIFPLNGYWAELPKELRVHVLSYLDIPAVMNMMLVSSQDYALVELNLTVLDTLNNRRDLAKLFVKKNSELSFAPTKQELAGPILKQLHKESIEELDQAKLDEFTRQFQEKMGRKSVSEFVERLTIGEIYAHGKMIFSPSGIRLRAINAELMTYGKKAVVDCYNENIKSIREFLKS